MKTLLDKYGYAGDNCMLALLTYFSERKGTWINKAELSLQRFPYTEKGVIKYFSPETIGRKARKLAELSLLQRKEVNHQSLYAWPENQDVPKRFMRMEYEIKDGVRYARPVMQ